MLNLVSMEDIQTGSSQRLKLSKGDAKRVSFVLFPGYDTNTPDFEKFPLFARARRIYAPGLGNVIDEGPASKITGIQSREYFATIVAVWPTKAGTMNPSLNSILDGDFELKYWVMTKTRMEDIKKAHAMAGVGISTADIGISCSDEQYQKYQYQSLPESLYYKFSNSEKTAELVADINAKILKMVPQLEAQLGQRISADEIRQRWSEQAQDGAENTSNASGSRPSSVVVPPGVATSDAEDILGSL